MKNIRGIKDNLINIFEILIFIIVLLIIILLLAYYFNNKEYKVTFINGNTTYAYQVIKKGNKIVIPDPPEKEDYEFIGWSLDGNLYNFDIPIDNDIKLVAEWKYKEK